MFPGPNCEPQTFYPCSPYVTPDDLPCDCAGVDMNDPENIQLFNDMAEIYSTDLFDSTGRKYTGCCELTFIPCREKCDDAAAAIPGLEDWPYPSIPIQTGFTSTPTFINCWKCSCACDTCNCWGGDKLELPMLPAREIVEIVIDGEILDASKYQIVESVWLVRTDGGRWPSLSCGDDDAFRISYRYGWDLPPIGKRLFAQYVCELVRECKGLDCALSEIHRTETRLIVKGKIERSLPKVQYLDDNLLTGYPPLDRWIMRDRGGMSIFEPTVWPNTPSGRIVT